VPILAFPVPSGKRPHGPLSPGGTLNLDTRGIVEAPLARPAVTPPSHTRPMGGRGKPEARQEARRLRAEGWTLAAIAAAVGAAKGTVSVWVRDVSFEPRPRGPRAARRRPPNALARRKAAEIAALAEEGRARVGALSTRDLLLVGTALYAGEGSKTGNRVRFTNTDPAMVRLFCTWLRRFFDIDESRLRATVYLHQGLDLEAAIAFWSDVTRIPPTQFTAPYRAVPDASIRTTKHPTGCAYVNYSSARTHRAVMGLVDALLRSEVIPG